jgi:hypothetical protein
MGQYASRAKFIELFLILDNSTVPEYPQHYMGVYEVCEYPKVSPSRVAMRRPTRKDLTGGYLLQIDRINPNTPNYFLGKKTSTPFMIDYPSPSDAPDVKPAAYMDYIKEFVNEFESVLYSDNFKDPVNGYMKYIDRDSFIDYLLVTEFTQNIDGNPSPNRTVAHCNPHPNPIGLRFSTYLHKRPGKFGKLHMGPVWDYDIAFGNVYYASCHKTTGFRHNSHDPVHIMKLTWYDRLMQDRIFCIATVKRWRHLRKTILSNDNTRKLIDGLNSYLNEAAGRNFERWEILGRYVWPGSAPYAQSFGEEIENLKYWLRQRFWWMDGMRCAKKNCHLFSKHVRRPDPPLLQTFTYINEVGKAYRKGDKQAIMRTLAEAAAPPHCWTCQYTRKSNWHGLLVWDFEVIWLRLFQPASIFIIALVGLGVCYVIPLCWRAKDRRKKGGGMWNRRTSLSSPDRDEGGGFSADRRSSLANPVWFPGSRSAASGGAISFEESDKMV